MKLDSVAAMLKLDQILKATELSLSVVAALPGLAFTWILFSATARYKTWKHFAPTLLS